MGPLLFYQTSESDLRAKAVNVGQILGKILGKMGEAGMASHQISLEKYSTTRITVQAGHETSFAGVEQKTNGKQSPRTSSSFSSDF